MGHDDGGKGPAAIGDRLVRRVALHEGRVALHVDHARSAWLSSARAALEVYSVDRPKRVPNRVREEEEHHAAFLIEGSYIVGGLGGPGQESEDREKAFTALVERAGGKLKAFYYALRGERRSSASSRCPTRRAPGPSLSRSRRSAT